MPFESYETPFVSYSQAREDVVLVRSLRDIPPERGFYIDVGAYDPDVDSVTRAFYEAGWRGINIEPSPVLIAPFRHARPRDVNLEVAVSSVPGELTFFTNGDSQLGTLEERYAHAGSARHAVPVTTLTQVCEEHAPDDFHFLKIDVEGHERGVLEGMDFARFRPWILIIEAVVPNTHIPTQEEWESLVIGSGYRFVLADAINRFYLADERCDLAGNCSLVADNFYQRREWEELHQARARISELEREVEQLRRHQYVAPPAPAARPKRGYLARLFR